MNRWLLTFPRKYYFTLSYTEMGGLFSLSLILPCMCQIDPSILGGLVVEFGQKVFDKSIKTRAKQMERFLRDPVNIDNL